MECAKTQNIIQLNSSDTDVVEDIKSLIDSFGADICTIYSIRKKLAFRVLSVSNENINKENFFIQIIDFNVSRDSIMFNMYEKKEVVAKEIKEGEMPLFFGVNYEVAIPIMFGDTLVGGLYLGSIVNDCIDVDIERINEIINKHSLKLKDIACDKILDNMIIKNAILTHELFNEKSEFMVQHIYNVASWATEIAKKMKYSAEKISQIYIASLLHDLGKIYIDKNILNKEGKLTDEEYNEMKKHVEIGYNTAKGIFISNSDIPVWISQHHEKWDGTGYPNKLKGEEITIEGRILKIADSLDAILSKRSYKEKKSLSEAIIELKKCKGKDFDPQIADITIGILKERLNYSQYDLEDVILPCKLIVRTLDKKYYFDGFIQKIQEEIIFESKKPMYEIEKKDILDLSLIVEKHNIIFEFNAKIKRMDTYKLLLNDFSPKIVNNAFGLMWDLSGKLILTTTKEAKQIRITKISGNDIVFNLQQEQSLEEDKLHIVLVQFDDGTKIPLTGKIVNKVKLSKKTHYKFEFVGIKENYRDEVFRQVFRKQISIKKNAK